MAEQIKAGAGDAFDPDAFKTAVGDVNRSKEKAREHNGQAGKLTKEACDEHNFDKTAFTFMARLSRKEASQQAETFRHVIQMGAALGMADHLDMFDGVIETMQEIIDTVHAGQPASKSESAKNVARLASREAATVN